MKVLLVDDDRVTRFAFTRFLCGKGIDVLNAVNGAEAIELLHLHHVKIVITDLLMPVMNGLKLVESIRASAAERSYTYIIMLTGRNEKNAIIKGIKAGVDEFLFKPTKPEELYVRVRAAQSIVEFKEKNQISQRKLQRDYDNICNELKLAAKVQQSMLPKKGKLGDFTFDWLFYPCSGGYVAGDVFNYFPINKDYLGFYQIDVSGHGVSAALLSVTLYHQIAGRMRYRGNALTDSDDIPLPPSQIIMQLNAEFQSPDVSQYFTVVYGYIECATGRICLAQAGHPPVLYIKADGRTEQLDVYGIPVGMFSSAQYTDVEFYMESGTRLFIYSDGVTDCRDTAGVLCSEQRFKAVLQESCHLPLATLLKNVENHLMERNHYSGGFDDDTSFLVVEYQK